MFAGNKRGREIGPALFHTQREEKCRATHRNLLEQQFSVQPVILRQCHPCAISSVLNVAIQTRLRISIRELKYIGRRARLRRNDWLFAK